MAEHPVQQDNVTPLQATPVTRRGIGVRAVAVAVLTAAVVAYGAFWVFDRLSHVHVVDARISSTMILVSSRVPGWITEFGVDEGDRVAIGDVLLQVDARSMPATSSPRWKLHWAPSRPT